ncbi:hypothetical protein [Bradyrhizobium sp. CCGB01]|uniref:hypothetical protein n=1 Tax=Bradyrhizobium sp. CCGB01 TaxID=2949634 RepID=UPI0020B23794|nr:hypothetical protein [Bradyrhizobium sp. CCGB01]MCP3406143.1 hypothetical protein [Bradyrhizobium sp. CCGB01]
MDAFTSAGTTIGSGLGAGGQPAFLLVVIGLSPSDYGRIAEDQIAAEAGVHPAIVAGRWQREHADYRRFSKMLGRGEVSAQLEGDYD